MATLLNSAQSFPDWSPKAKQMAAEAKVLTGSKLEQLVVRIQRHTGRPKETCWRFVIQYGNAEATGSGLQEEENNFSPRRTPTGGNKYKERNL